MVRGMGNIWGVVMGFFKVIWFVFTLYDLYAIVV